MSLIQWTYIKCCTTQAADIFQNTQFIKIYSLERRQWHPTPVLCLENPMDGGAWWAAVHGVAKSGARLSDFTFTFHFHALEKEMATHSSVLAWRIWAWWAAVYGVAQSRTWLKRLSSSSSSSSSRWLVMLSIFSCVWWSSLCLLWKNV